MTINEVPNMGGSTISNKLINKLIKELKSGMFSGADRLPSELELAEQFGVSRTVIRDALGTLEREGFIERGRGIGTIVHRNVVNMVNRFDLKYEYNLLVQNMGYKPGVDNVKLSERQADEDLAEKLDLDVGDTVIVCEKRILANEKPVIYSFDHFPKKLFIDLDLKKMDWSRPVFDLLEEYCEIKVDTDITYIKPTNGTPHIRKMLELKCDEALLLLDEMGYYKLSKTILHSYGFYTDFFDFVMLRKYL